VDGGGAPAPRKIAPKDRARIACFQDFTAFGAAAPALRVPRQEAARPDGLGRVVTPRFDGSTLAKRFDDAVSRACVWR
jgi:hypothetical protein